MDIIINNRKVKADGVVHRIDINGIIIEVKVQRENASRRRCCDTAIVYQDLPEEFGQQEVEEEMRRRGMRSPARQVIYRWARSEMVERLGHGKYRKIV